MTTTTQIDEAKLQQVVGRAVDDLGALSSAALVLIGDRLGLYRTLERIGPSTPSELAEATGTDERYVRPWLTNQAAAGYVDYSPETKRFLLSPEQSMLFTDPDSPVGMIGSFEVFVDATKAGPRITEAIRNREGMAWGEHEVGVIEGTATAFRAAYLANLVPNWLPALDGVVEKLERGALVADVGCGYGYSTIILARAFPNSRFIGIDNHELSIEKARAAAVEEGVADRVTFVVGTAQDFSGEGLDLVTFFDAIHDMGDPLSAARHARAVLKPDGTVLAVEPMAGQTVEGNFNPVGRMYSAASVLICSAHAISEGNPHPLGTIATDAELAGVFHNAGFGFFRRATESVQHRVFEVRP